MKLANIFRAAINLLQFDGGVFVKSPEINKIYNDASLRESTRASLHGQRPFVNDASLHEGETAKGGRGPARTEARGVQTSSRVGDVLKRALRPQCTYFDRRGKTTTTRPDATRRKN